jgi:repressor LexA
MMLRDEPPLPINREIGRGHVIQGNFGRTPPPMPEKRVPEKTVAPADDNVRLVEIPMHGRIAAGTPIEALQDDNLISVPASLLGKGEHYALEVAGDSMIDAGILDGDTVIIRRCDTADNGAIVVALVNGIEATLKYLHRKGSQIALKPANPAYKAQILPSSHVIIQGRLVALFRHY